MAGLSIQRVVKRFGTHPAVDDVSLEIESGELIALLGPSGCGKTTLLRMIAGFERLDAGRIDFDDKCMADETHHVPPEDRRVGMVFQAYALWPHMSVAENVAYPLRVRGIEKTSRASRVTAALEQVGMSGLEGRRPADLSGGQRQRVALARCLVMEPSVVLLDEPLANLDVHLREAMQAEFRAFHDSTGATMVYVTHDQSEAMALADRVAVMMNGRFEQVAPPRALYAEPATAAVARFVGHGMVVPGEVIAADDPGYFEVSTLGAHLRVRGAGTASGQCQICLRAERLRVESQPAPDRIATIVRDATFRGHTTTLHVAPLSNPDETLHVNAVGTPPDPGVTVHLAVDDGWCMP